jgi:hypothetical protein
MNSTAQPFYLEDDGCNYCEPARVRISSILERPSSDLSGTIKRILRGRNPAVPFDCVIGVSGGVDSSWLLAKAVELGLKPLAVHMDNGWNSAQASDNIFKLVDRLDVPLETLVLDWHQQRRAQLAFLKADVVDVELLYDNALQEVCYKFAKQHGVKFVLGGNNSLSEGVEVGANWVWHKWDGLNIRSILRRARASSSGYPIFSIYKYLGYRFAARIEWINLLDYIPNYGKDSALSDLMERFDYRPYGSKHFENVFTRFYQGVILPEKFGIDKRRPHFSSQIIRGEMTRNEALTLLEAEIYPTRSLRIQDFESICSKLGVAPEWMSGYLSRPPRSHGNYLHDPTVNYFLPIYSRIKKVFRAKEKVSEG